MTDEARNKLIKYIEIAAGVGSLALAIIGLLEFRKKMLNYDLTNEKTILEKQLLTLQIKDLQNKAAA